MPKQADRCRGRATPDPTLRIGDAERNDVAEALSHHYSAGRLDDTELKERLDAAMRAKTGADLVGLVSDLPPIGSPGPQHPVPETPRRRRSGLWIVFGAVLLVALLAHGPFWWPWWSAVRFFWLIVAVVLFVLWRRARRHRGHEEIA